MRKNKFCFAGEANKIRNKLNRTLHHYNINKLRLGFSRNNK